MLVFKRANKIVVTAREGSNIKQMAQQEQDSIMADIGCRPKVIQLLEDIQAMETNRMIDPIDSV